MKEEVFKFLSSKTPKLCVLATASNEAKPQCAVMGYTLTPNLEVILSTDSTSRKQNNLQQNHVVALTFGWSFEEFNIQYEGVAQLVKSGDEYKKCEETYFTSHPESEEFKGIPETVFIKVKPTWIRLSDYSTTPPRIEELFFNSHYSA